ncbi:MAG: prepilin-type N-terminal cleavage/methylation domain-containing protein [Krumholzibacteria bacterium]|nr:prepilin-type N-terminal cleavage/methylation domain-containing protein [Candidatus Krumholzibacteria bacterium]
MLRQLERRLRRLPGRPRAGRAGFSLVEIMIVLVILAVGVLPIAVVQHHARREVVEADRHTEAIALAQAQLERLKGLGFGNIVAENGVTGTFAWQAQVANVSFGLDRVDVTVTWNTSNAAEILTVSELVSMR